MFYLNLGLQEFLCSSIFSVVFSISVYERYESIARSRLIFIKIGRTTLTELAAFYSDCSSEDKKNISLLVFFPMDIVCFSQPKNINWLFLQILSCLCSVSGATLELGHKDWLLNIETNPWSETPDWTHDWSLLWFKLVQWTMKFCLKLAK